MLAVDGKPLDLSAAVANCYSLLLGATVTTPHALSATLLELIETDSYQTWAAHPELMATAVEEALRWSSPANHFMRYATRDIDLHGAQIVKGDAVVSWLGSANRDAEEFCDPYSFDIGRRPNRHVAFGVGPHYCVGHRVARQLLHVVFEQLFRGLD